MKVWQHYYHNGAVKQHREGFDMWTIELRSTFLDTLVGQVSAWSEQGAWSAAELMIQSLERKDNTR